MRNFLRCFSLKMVFIPDSIEEIDCSAFYACSALVSVQGKPLDKITVRPTAFDLCGGSADENGFVVVNGILFNSPAIYRNKKIRIPEYVSVIVTAAHHGGPLEPQDWILDCWGDINFFLNEKNELICPGYCREIVMPPNIRIIEGSSIPERIRKLYLQEGTSIDDTAYHKFESELAHVKLVFYHDYSETY